MRIDDRGKKSTKQQTQPCETACRRQVEKLIEREAKFEWAQTNIERNR